ncbi:MAG TPA: tail fiber domain-containing protein [Thermoanaerobaculia bacterium]
MKRSLLFRSVLILAIATMPFAAFAANIGNPVGGGSSISWQVSRGGYNSIELTVSSPSGYTFTDTFRGGQSPSFSIADADTLSDMEDGVYNYELRLVPNVSADVAKKLAAARKSGDDAAARKIMKDAGLEPVVQSGSFTVVNGRIVDPNLVEADANDSVIASRNFGVSTDAVRPGTPTTNDQVIADDLIVQGSGCFGFDCVNNESFGFDTIRLKENNLRIKFEDTSVGAFPSNDWQLTANDSASGGANKFSIEDITGSKVPFTVTAGATTNSIFVDSTGRVGFRTSTPVLDLHVNTSNTPALRLEQNNTGGFTAQTWDIAGNEANFFVRDVTSGSRLPFRIRPGAPTSSLDISADGAIGIGTASPNTNSALDVVGAIRLTGTANPTTDNGAWQWNEAGVGYVFQSGGTIRFRTGATSSERLVVTTAGDVGINCSTPSADFVIFGTANCSGSGSTINAGATQFTATSSRTMKEHLAPVAVPDLLDRIAKVNVYNYDFITGPKDRVGLMAEDFHTVFGRGSDKVIDGNEVQMALWMAVQQLTEQNKKLQERLDTLEQQAPKQ